jgi:formylglycine-generating enzyme required for sulfatase activity
MADDPLPHMVRIPSGEFVMGADDGDDDEKPAHAVHVDEFYIGVFPITNNEYLHFVRDAGYEPPGIRHVPMMVPAEREGEFRELATPFVWHEGRPPAGRDNHPVTLVRFDDAAEYCAWLSARTGQTFRLPTEAEWEKAARGRSAPTTRYPWGDEIDPSRANFLIDPSAKHSRSTSAVGQYPPNSYQVHDVVGNVWEWVTDWYGADYYAKTRYQNPAGPDAGRLRIIRGGSWVNDDVAMLRVSHRHKVPPDTYAYSIGFRIVSPRG